jgi:hypothetical protein
VIRCDPPAASPANEAQSVTCDLGVVDEAHPLRNVHKREHKTMRLMASMGRSPMGQAR